MGGPDSRGEGGTMKASRLTMFMQHGLIAAVFANVLGIYIKTLYPSISGGDSGELVANMCSGGVAHPPGYPLWLLIAKGWSNLLGQFDNIEGNNPAWRSNLLSAVLGTLASVVICYTTLALITELSASENPKTSSVDGDWPASLASSSSSGRGGGKKKYAGGNKKHNGQRGNSGGWEISEKELAELVKQDRSSLPPSSQFSVSDEQNINLTSALAAGGLFALSPSIWSYAIQAEVFPLNNLLIAMTTYLWIMYRRAIINENWTTAKIMGLLGALGCGLAISNQHTSMVHAAVTALAVLFSPLDGSKKLVRTNLRQLIYLGLAGLVGLTPYLYLIYASAQGREGAWGNLTTVGGFFKHFLRQEYGTFRMATSEVAEDSPLSQKFIIYFSRLSKDTLHLGLPLLAIGVYRCYKSHTARIMMLSAGLYLTVINCMANLPMVAFRIEVISRMWEQASVIAYIFIGIGLRHCLRTMALSCSSNNSNLAFQLATSFPRFAPLLIMSLLTFQARLNFHDMDNSQNWAFVDFADDLIRPLPVNSLLLVKDDLNAYPLMYMRQCEGLKPDVGFLRLPMVTYTWWKETQLHLYPSLAYPGTHHHPFMEGAWNLSTFLDANNRDNRWPGGIYVAGPWTAGDPTNNVYQRFILGHVDRLIKPDGMSFDLERYLQDIKKFAPKEFSQPLRLPDRPLMEGSWEEGIVRKNVVHLATIGMDFHAKLHTIHDPTFKFTTPYLRYVLEVFEKTLALCKKYNAMHFINQAVWFEATVVAGKLSLRDDTATDTKMSETMFMFMRIYKITASTPPTNARADPTRIAEAEKWIKEGFNPFTQKTHGPLVVWAREV